MSYEQGEVKVAWRRPSPDFDDLDDPDVLLHHEDEDVDFPVAYLPHSCDEWLIGGPEQVRQMIADLQAALAKMEAR